MYPANRLRNRLEIRQRDGTLYTRWGKDYPWAPWAYIYSWVEKKQTNKNNNNRFAVDPYSFCNMASC